MTEPSGGSSRLVHDDVCAALVDLLAATDSLPAHDLLHAVELTAGVLGAASATVLVADYGMLSLQALGADGPTGDPQPIEGTMAGRALSDGQIVVSPGDPDRVWVPLTEGTERIGVLALDHPDWGGVPAAGVGPVVRLLVLLLISRRRYTDAVLRSRRSEPLSTAAEMQWGLLPPLTCSTQSVSLSGILEPAYSIGGDSFDYALNGDGVEFAIVDGVGHGMTAVLLAVTAVSALRNCRRERHGLEAAYLATGSTIVEQFGQSWYVTGQIGRLDTATGALTWINAGHPLPLLVRNGHVRELQCKPSFPMGLRGAVAEVAVEHLQAGDRVLFYSDGAVESRSPEGVPFGVPRLADHLAVATNDGVPPAETVRRLSSSIMAFNGEGLSDDATLLILEYRGVNAGPRG